MLPKVQVGVGQGSGGVTVLLARDWLAHVSWGQHYLQHYMSGIATTTPPTIRVFGVRSQEDERVTGISEDSRERTRLQWWKEQRTWRTTDTRGMWGATERRRGKDPRGMTGRVIDMNEEWGARMTSHSTKWEEKGRRRHHWRHAWTAVIR